jgi:hypothetical protein
MGRTFMLFFVDPEQPILTETCQECHGFGTQGDDVSLHCDACHAGKVRKSGVTTLLDTLATIPCIEQQFLPMSDILLLLDAIKSLPRLATDPPPCKHLNRKVVDGQQSAEHITCLDCGRRWTD